MISRGQYVHYEVGEFTGDQERTEEETIQLIRDFPWVEQCHLTPVGTTAPSITLDDGMGSYLKTGHYYNSKFCLYYLQAGGTFLKKIVTSLDEAISVARDFYNGRDITAGFNKDTLPNARKHFVVNDFVYRVDVARIFRYMLFTIIITLPSLALLCWMVAMGGDAPWAFFAVVVVMCMFFFGINWLLFFNYYRYSKDLFVSIAKCHDIFRFGTAADFKEYSKSDIETIVVRQAQPRRAKGPIWSEFKIYEVTFKNGEMIRFPNLLIDNSFTSKVTHPQQLVFTAFPFIK